MAKAKGKAKTPPASLPLSQEQNPVDMLAEFISEMPKWIDRAIHSPVPPVCHAAKSDLDYPAEERRCEDERKRIREWEDTVQHSLTRLSRIGRELAPLMKMDDKDTERLFHFLQMLDERLVARYDWLALYLPWRELKPMLEAVRVRLQAQEMPVNTLLTGEPAADGNADLSQANGGSPFYKPAYFQKWKISDDLLRRNAIDGSVFKAGKVRRQNITPSNSTIKLPANRTAKPRKGKRISTKGKPRPVYWYSEPDARKRWPEKFSAVQKQPPKT
jgi:hypothetical protein